MADEPIARRYAQAVFDTAKAERAVEDTLAQLALIGNLMRDHAALQELMFNPDVDPDDKVGVLERSLRGSWSPLVRAFIEMVVSSWRAEYLPEIVEAFQAMVEEDEGRLRVLVRSAHPLSEAALGRIKTRLEHREGKHITVQPEVDTGLLGGLQLFLGNRVLDSSVKRQLNELRERLMSVKVL